MCKIVTLTNTKNLDAKAISEAIGGVVQGIEKDGYGYAVQGKSGVFGEKCIAPSFSARIDIKNTVKLPIIEARQSAFGTKDKPIGPGIFHGRTSTNDKGLLNCHPMQKSGWHLIHNGVVDDNGPEYSKKTTNDSEDVLHRLIKGISEVEKHLSGYYAFSAIDPEGRLHIARDSVATLYVAWLPKAQSYLICTTESLLKSVAEALKLKHGPIDKVQDDIYMIFQGNELLSSQTIKPLGYTYNQSKYAGASLGYSLDGQSTSYEPYESYETYEDYEDYRTRPSAEAMEVDAIDDSYLIWNSEGTKISAAEFHKLDFTRQAECIIEGIDGNVLEIPDDKWVKNG